MIWMWSHCLVEDIQQFNKLQEHKKFLRAKSGNALCKWTELNCNEASYGQLFHLYAAYCRIRFKLMSATYVRALL